MAYEDPIAPALAASGVPEPRIADRQVSADGTRKYVFEFADGARAEAVGMPIGDEGELRVCFSSQVGCAMGCAFCNTGRQGLTRNLESAEMLWQIALVGRDFGRPADAVLAMGQGEPLVNHAALIEALSVLARPDVLGLSGARIMPSTCGIPEGIRALAEAPLDVLLNVSLHAATQSLRDVLMPGVSGVPLAQLHDELARYCERTGRKVVLTYLMLAGVNDREEDLAALQEFCQGLDCMVVLLKYNRVEGMPFEASSNLQKAYWLLALGRAGIPAAANHSRGGDIAAACGQLVNRRGATGQSGAATPGAFRS